MAVQATLVHLIWGRGCTRARSAASCHGHECARHGDRLGAVAPLGLGLAAVLAAFVFAGPLHLEPATIALAGAAVLMLLDNLQQRDSRQADHVHATFAEIEWTTIFFFIGLFVVVHAVEASGFLTAAGKLVALTGGISWRPATVILWSSAFLSAIIDNIPFVATMIPLIKDMGPAFGGPNAIEPLWWSLALGACLGGNGTLIGAASNLAVAGIAERNGIRFGFIRYLAYGAPMTLVSIAFCQVYVWIRYF